MSHVVSYMEFFSIQQYSCHENYDGEVNVTCGKCTFHSATSHVSGFIFQRGTQKPSNHAEKVYFTSSFIVSSECRKWPRLTRELIWGQQGESAGSQSFFKDGISFTVASLLFFQVFARFVYFSGKYFFSCCSEIWLSKLWQRTFY